jgi:hypothetical protein
VKLTICKGKKSRSGKNQSHAYNKNIVIWREMNFEYLGEVGWQLAAHHDHIGSQRSN